MESYRSTPAAWPWIVHAAEGLNAEASNEFERLDALGCLMPNTLLVHGIALQQAQRERLLAAGAAVIWCPSSNLNLFGKTAQVADLARRVALGTDSRLSGSRDLLEELRIAMDLAEVADERLEEMVTSTAADLLRLADRGSLRAGLRADLLIVPAGKRLGSADRRDVRLVMVNGAPRYGDVEYIRRAGLSDGWTRVWVDGVPKMLEGRISNQIAQSRAIEPGLDIPCLSGRAA
jgi:cytosine/adenosine deaminase-related metal-dependent hydrolase